MGHDHSHEHAHDHSHAHSSSLKVLLIAIIITGLFAIVEALTGWFANSLTLMGDAGHMIADTLSLGIAATAAWIATRPSSSHQTYGFGRIEVLAAFVSGIMLLGIVVAIVLEAIEHLRTPEFVHGQMVIVVGVIGLLANLLVAWILNASEQNLNVKAALLHVISDILGSMAAIIAGIVVYFTGWMPIDPILSLFISLLILRSTIKLLLTTFHILMEGSPEHIDVDEVEKSLGQISQIKSVHDLHIWTLTSNQALLSAHVLIDDLANWNTIFQAIKSMLCEEYHIEHITIQPETAEFPPMSCDNLHHICGKKTGVPNRI